MTYQILRLPQVINQTGQPRSTLYLRINQGLWPKPVSLGARCVGWPSHEVETLNNARIAGQTDSQIKHLVDQMYQARTKAFNTYTLNTANETAGEKQ